MTTVWMDGDIAMLLAAVGAVPVAIDGVQGIGTLDWNDEVVTSDGTRAQVIVGVPMLTIQSSAFPNAAVDSVVQIDGNTYTVRERLKYGDGGNTKLYLGIYTGPPLAPMLLDGGALNGTGGSGPNVDGGALAGTGGSGPSVSGGGF